MRIQTVRDLQVALRDAASRGDTRAAVRRAARIVGVRVDQELDVHQLVRICSALSAEGGAIQEVAEQIASDALRDEPHEQSYAA